MQVNIDDLSDDPELAFVELADQFDALMKQELKELDEESDSKQVLVEHKNNVLAAAKALEISPAIARTGG